MGRVGYIGHRMQTRTNAQSKRKFMSAKEAAALLEVNITTIARWCRNKAETGIPAYYFGGKTIKIPRAQFYKWAKLNEWKDD